MKALFKILLFFTFYIISAFFYASKAYAIVDPLSVTNNRFGIHIISPNTNEASVAASLVNADGDWGYITVVIEDKDRDLNKWQNFFDDLRVKHLIPIVRLATHPQGNNWAVPATDLANNWADFLDQLNWPIKNRYVTIYNEPNHGSEWGGSVDPISYAKTLDSTITALKNKNQDFFVLNAGFDASTPEAAPNYKDQLLFMQMMEKSVPGIFEKLDGWVSHSYPNPGFVGSPDDFGRGTVRTYAWELQKLKDLGVKKNLPVFITETGWRHAEGVVYNPSLPSASKVADYFKIAFNDAWNNFKIVAITPFLLNYPQTPFDHFSFTKPEKDQAVNQDLELGKEVLGAKYPDGRSRYYESFLALQEIPKSIGAPIQEIKAKLTKGEVYTSIVVGESYKIQLTFKNTGQSIWGEGEPVRLVSLAGGAELGMIISGIPSNQKVKPNEDHTFDIEFKAPLIPASTQNQSVKVILNLFKGNQEFTSNRIEFDTKIKSPVVLQIKSALLWKKTAAGAYVLSIVGPVSETVSLTVDGNGVSKPIEAKTVLPDYGYDFTLQRSYYKPKTIHQSVGSGLNILDFGSLKPDLFTAILNPAEFWKLLPWSN